MLPNRFVSWGGTDELGSHRHVLRHYSETASKMGIVSMWLADTEANRAYLAPGTIVFAFDVAAKNLGAALPGVKYVIHNFDASHPVCRTADPDLLLRLQVYTNDSFGEPWAPFRLYDKESHIIFQPWGTDLVAEEFFDPVFNPAAQEIVFVGAIWSEMHDGTDLGNKQLIDDLRAVAQERHLKLSHYTHISDRENVLRVREARLAPALAGGWQVSHNYLPCRVFKNFSYGQLGFTNVPVLAKKLGMNPYLPIGQALDAFLSLRRPDYLDRVRAGQRFVADYTYRESIQAIIRAFGERDV